MSRRPSLAGNFRGSVYMSIGEREIFCQGGGGVGGAVNHFAKNISQVPQIFTKESKRNEGHIATT